VTGESVTCELVVAYFPKASAFNKCKQTCPSSLPEPECGSNTETTLSLGAQIFSYILTNTFKSFYFDGSITVREAELGLRGCCLRSTFHLHKWVRENIAGPSAFRHGLRDLDSKVLDVLITWLLRNRIPWTSVQNVAKLRLNLWHVPNNGPLPELCQLECKKP